MLWPRHSGPSSDRNQQKQCGNLQGARSRVNAVRDRMSLRATDSIRTPQPSPPTNRLCQYTSHDSSGHTVPHHACTLSDMTDTDIVVNALACAALLGACRAQDVAQAVVSLMTAAYSKIAWLSSFVSSIAHVQGRVHASHRRR